MWMLGKGDSAPEFRDKSEMGRETTNLRVDA